MQFSVLILCIIQLTKTSPKADCCYLKTFATLMWHLRRFSLLNVTVKVLADRCLQTGVGRAGLMYEWMQFGGSLKAVVVTTGRLHTSCHMVTNSAKYPVAFILSVCLDSLCPHVPTSLSVLHRGNNKAHKTIVNQRSYLQTCDCILRIRRVEDRWTWLHKTRWESLQDELARKQAVKWGHLRKTMEAFLPPPCIPVRDSLTTSERSQSRCVVACHFWGGDVAARIKSVRKEWHAVRARLGFT